VKNLTIKSFFITTCILFANCSPPPSSSNAEVASILPLLQSGSNTSSIVKTDDTNTGNTIENTTPPSYEEGTWLADTAADAPAHTGSGFQDKTKATNGVRGAGLGGGSTDVYSLQYASATPNDYIVLEWAGKKITNGPGIDFIVFENAFKVGTSTDYFMDIAIVEVSNDRTNWCGFNPDYVFTPETTYSKKPEHWLRFAGRTPVLFHETTNNFNYVPAQVFNTVNSGGDGFNLDDLSDVNNLAGGSGCNTTLRDELKAGFTYIRLSSAPSTRWKNPDTNAAFVKEAISNGADFDGVYARYRKTR